MRRESCKEKSHGQKTKKKRKQQFMKKIQRADSFQLHSGEAGTRICVSYCGGQTRSRGNMGQNRKLLAQFPVWSVAPLLGSLWRHPWRKTSFPGKASTKDVSPVIPKQFDHGSQQMITWQHVAHTWRTPIAIPSLNEFERWAEPISVTLNCYAQALLERDWLFS